MRIKNLNLKNFRNYLEEDFSFSDGLNVLFGKNAQGKTNCAEAVFYLCTGVSPRARREKQLIRDGAEFAEISTVAEGRYGEVNLYAKIMDNGREVRVNGNKISKNADLLGNIFAVFFSPHELRLIQDGPDERRRFLNVSISQLSKPYYTALMRYNKILEQRNNLLKNRDISLIYDTLPVWDEQLCKYASTIARKRAEFIESLAPLAKSTHAFLTDNKEELCVYPEKKYKGDELELAKRLFSELEANYERDIRLGYTASGPHRDDIGIDINGLDAKIFASQGQTRTAALSIKLAEVEIFKEISGEYPVLILDDVMSELDLPRRKKLVERTQGLQTILTCTHAERVLYGKEVNKIKIEGGKIKR
ncbi:MAG: DNA replication/repair protein RecF [Clostridiales bacterium]|nr:DNA replication/repair protein RecF [Clostridiales bacterium]